MNELRRGNLYKHKDPNNGNQVFLAFKLGSNTDIGNVKVLEGLKYSDNPKKGDYIVSFEDESGWWLSPKDTFEENYIPIENTGILPGSALTEKTLANTTLQIRPQNVKDIQFWGNGDTFQLISKAWSNNEGWMKSTKAMEIPKVGCVVQVTTQDKSGVAEAVTFVPGVKIKSELSPDGEVVGRSLVKI